MTVRLPNDRMTELMVERGRIMRAIEDQIEDGTYTYDGAVTQIEAFRPILATEPSPMVRHHLQSVLLRFRFMLPNENDAASMEAARERIRLGRQRLQEVLAEIAEAEESG